MKRRLRFGVVVAVGATLLTTGCGFHGLYSTPLPGGADLGDHPYVVKAEFSDVLDLVPQASVRLADVPVGKVVKIELEPDNKTALVTMRVNGSVRLAANADAALRQSSLLGEKYVELSGAPAGGAKGALSNGMVIPLARTERTATVEEVLGALSLLLNGGGIQRIQGITKELNDALAGHEPQIRAMLSNVDKLVRDLDGQRDNILHAIDGLNRLSGTLAGQRGKIANALDNIGPGLKVLNSQRDQLVTMLKSLDHLSGVAVDTVQRSKSDMVHDLRSLAPTLDKLAEAGNNLPKSLQILLTYPFSNYAMNDLRGDFFNAKVHLNFDLSNILQTMNKSPQPLIPGLGNPATIEGSGAGGKAANSQSPVPGATSGGGTVQDGLSGLLGSLLGGG
ncbi:MAG: MCE family protein [Sciscionella sp.]